VIGSAADCDLVLGDPSVSRRHAEIWVSGDQQVHLRDLGSLNGTFVAARRIREQTVAAGDSIGFGHATLLLERVAEDEIDVGLSLQPPPVPLAVASVAGSTFGSRAVEVFALQEVPALLRALRGGADATRIAALGGAALHRELPILSIEIALRAGDAAGVLFDTHRGSAAGEPTEVAAASGEVTVRAAFPDPRPGQLFRPLIESVAHLVALAAGAPATAIGAAPPAAPPVPDPPSVVPELQRIYADAAQAARGEIGILVTGESGTGKEVLARYVHLASRRADQAFVALNCAALPRDLIEAELFGIERGVATGVEARAGKFEQADGGTLFLDEIGDMALETQSRLLRVLQEGEVFRIGGKEPRKARVRVIAATNRPMGKMLAEGRFREDLYYRIATWVVELPPLRRRKADIPSLAAFFLAREAARSGVRLRGLSHAAVDALRAAPWPGNIRQLEKEMARVVLFLRGADVVETSHLGPEFASRRRAAPDSLQAILDQTEREEIERALASKGGDVESAAEALGIGRSTLYRRIKELAIAAPAGGEG
jgi:hypothetical protein